MASLKDNNITNMFTNNFFKWKFKMQMTLIKRELFDEIQYEISEILAD